MPKLVSIVFALLVAALPASALGAAAGTARGVDPAADAAAADGVTRTLVVGADVFIGDLITTGPQGQVQILFADKTKLVVGPQSSLRIEDYLLRNDGSAGDLAVNVLGGAFRFITGESAKNRYRIDTPNGTIGVRGTAFDGSVGGGVSLILMYLGTTINCAEGEVDCELSSAYCEVTQIGDSEVQILGDARETTGEQREDLRSRFIYAVNESSLLDEFRITKAFDCLNKRPDVSGGGTITGPRGEVPPETPGNVTGQIP